MNGERLLDIILLYFFSFSLGTNDDNDRHRQGDWVSVRWPRSKFPDGMWNLFCTSFLPEHGSGKGGEKD